MIASESVSDDTSTYTDISVNPQLTFDGFMRMPSNETAYKAAVGISDGKIDYSPLCIFSETGCGKTHLLNAIVNRYLKQNPDKRVVLTSATRFVENYIDALQNCRMADFRSHYRAVDMLLIDDIEALCETKQFHDEMFRSVDSFDFLQDELFRVVVFLMDKHKPVVFASGQHPMRMKLRARLVERLTSGLTIGIEEFTKSECFDGR